MGLRVDTLRLPAAGLSPYSAHTAAGHLDIRPLPDNRSTRPTTPATMAAENSFDIESKVNVQEVRNAVLQAEKEIATRYDLKKAAAELRLEGEEVVLGAADEFSLNQAMEVVKTKLVRRGVQLKSLRYGKIEPASGGRVRQRITLQQGIPQETAKRLVAEIKARKLKVQAAIQGDTVRVSGKNRDDLQAVIAILKALDLDVPLSFSNYRSI
jgi:cyclic-di-GMP-binding protein